MRNAIVSWILLGLVLCAGCRKKEPAPPPAPEVLARFHFVGMDQLNRDTNIHTFKTIWALPQSADLRKQALQNLGLFSSGLLKRGLNLTNAEPVDDWIRPLLEDLLAAESYLEIRSQPNQKPEWTLAAQLSQAHAQIWKSNLWRLAASGKMGMPVNTNRDGAIGWLVKSRPETNALGFWQKGSWSLLSFGPDPWPTNYGVFPQWQRSGRPVAPAKDYFLDATVNGPALTPWLAVPAAARWPQTHLRLSAQGEYVRSKADLRWPEKQDWPLEKWSVPTNLIRDPLIGFTAIQGIGPWISRQESLKPLEIKTVPNQLFIWDQSTTPFHLYAAVPYQDATNFFRRFVDRLMPGINTNLQKKAVGELYSLTNQPGILWRGLPAIVPFLSPDPKREEKFLVGGLMPVPLGTNLAPAELFSEFARRTNLLCYDWEITQARLGQLRPLIKLLSLLTSKPFQATNSAAEKWLDASGSKLGNTVTELSVSAPQELTWVRKSHIGLTGAELIALAHWLENTNFPRWNLDIAFGPKRMLPPGPENKSRIPGKKK